MKWNKAEAIAEVQRLSRIKLCMDSESVSYTVQQHVAPFNRKNTSVFQKLKIEKNVQKDFYNGNMTVQYEFQNFVRGT